MNNQRNSILTNNTLNIHKTLSTPNQANNTLILNEISSSKSQVKSIINNSLLFPKIEETIITKLENIKKPPNILDFSLFLFNKSDAKINKILLSNAFKSGNSNTNNNIYTIDNKDVDLINKLLKISFQPENEYVNKFYHNYSDNFYLKLILISNLYRIFLINQISISQIKYTCYDFHCTLSLICSDFPKKIVENINEYYKMIKKEEGVSSLNAIGNNNNTINTIGNSNHYFCLFNNEINLSEFFIFFSVCFMNYELISKIRKLFIVFDYSKELGHINEKYLKKNEKDKKTMEDKDKDKEKIKIFQNNENFINLSNKEINNDNIKSTSNNNLKEEIGLNINDESNSDKNMTNEDNHKQIDNLSHVSDEKVNQLNITKSKKEIISLCNDNFINNAEIDRNAEKNSKIGIKNNNNNNNELFSNLEQTQEYWDNINFSNINTNISGYEDKYYYKETTMKEFLSESIENKLYISELKPFLEENVNLKLRFLEALCLCSTSIISEIEKIFVVSNLEIEKLLSNSNDKFTFPMFLKNFCYNEKVIGSVFNIDNLAFKLEQKLKNINMIEIG